jgi:hypothetical protein
MAIDPSIIGNVMVPRAPQMPDVNAMMQTRTAGMENVYKIERQRAEDAKAAQAAEADETVKALIPAYAYALGNPSDLTGALDLAPPELRGALEPYVAQLQGKPPEQVQAALIGSLSSSEVGRAFLETQGRMQTAEIQRGQLDVSRQREAREAAAAGRPKPMSEYEAERIRVEREKAAREAGKVPPETAKQQQAVREIDTAIAEISRAAAPGGLIDMSTNSIVGNLLDDIVAQASGGMLTLPGDVAAAQMEVIAHLARMAVPRFEGPQGVADAAIYERASGQLSDPNTSSTTRRAAAQTVVQMLNARRNQFVFSGAGGGAAPNEMGGADSDVLEYDADGNLVE